MTAKAPSSQELLAAVSGLAPEVAAGFDGQDEIFAQPHFDFVVKSTSKIPKAQAMNGTVVLRYPNFGDDLRIERMHKLLGGGNLNLMFATLAVCIESAPASWYELQPGAREPNLNLERLKDREALADLYIAFSDWQRSFR
jgi:hypothetical protein